MPEVLFYHLQQQPLEAVLPTLLQKTLERGLARGRAGDDRGAPVRPRRHSGPSPTRASCPMAPTGSPRGGPAHPDDALGGQSQRRRDPLPRRGRGTARGHATSYQRLVDAVRRQRRPGARHRPRPMARRQGGRPRGDLLAAGRARPVGAEGVRPPHRVRTRNVDSTRPRYQFAAEAIRIIHDDIGSLVCPPSHSSPLPSRCPALSARSGQEQRPRAACRAAGGAAPAPGERRPRLPPESVTRHTIELPGRTLKLHGDGRAPGADESAGRAAGGISASWPIRATTQTRQRGP